MTAKALSINVIHHKGEVLIAFSESVTMLTFAPAEARSFAEAIIKSANATEQGVISTTGTKQ
jgi:hypothetical protein